MSDSKMTAARAREIIEAWQVDVDRASFQSTKEQELNQALKKDFEDLLSSPDFDTAGPKLVAETQAAKTVGYSIIHNPAKPLDLPPRLTQKIDERIKASSEILKVCSQPSQEEYDRFYKHVQDLVGPVEQIPIKDCVKKRFR